MANTYPASLYSKEDIEGSKKAMAEYLAKISSGRLIPGCCTQDCCDAQAQESLFGAWFQPKATKNVYTREDILQAKASMLGKLAELSGGVLVAGCCTQGCCDPFAMAEMRILLP
jgi:hypothetical protein